MRMILTLGVLLVLTACSTGSPTIQTGPDAEVTYDGLHRVDNSAFRDSWADPDIDWTRYNKIMPGGAFFEFRAVKKSSSSNLSRASSTDNEYWIEEKDRKKLEQEVSDIFNEEVSKSSRFTRTDKPGPDVLIIRGGLQDIVSRVPPDMIGRGEIFLTSVGEATLILEVVDSQSGEVIARSVDRRNAERGGREMIRANTVTTWAEVRRLARSWATKLRDGLDSIPTN